MSQSQKPGTQVNTPVVGARAFEFEQKYRLPVGYIDKLNFPENGTDLVPDLEVPDPEDPTKTIKVVAVMDGRIFWKGGPTDPIEMEGRISAPNKADLRGVINGVSGGGDAAASFVLVDYDHAGKQYFRRFHTDGNLVQLVLTPGFEVDISDVPNTDIHEPINFTFRISFTAKSSAGKQQLFCAEAVNKKETKPLGGIGG